MTASLSKSFVSATLTVAMSLTLTTFLSSAQAQQAATTPQTAKPNISCHLR